MIIAQYLPRWLQSRLHKPASQKSNAPGKKDRQVLPTLPEPPPPPSQLDADSAPLRFRVYWRM
jgi:hypothetical protein